MTMTKRDRTPCEVLFDTMKRRGGIPHRELATLILSTSPLGDGRSPLEHARDRSWLSHVIVHAPIGAQQERYFLDYGMAATRVMGRLRSRRSSSMGAEEVLGLVRDSSQEAQRALDLCHQNPELYRNALARIVGQRGLSANERAKLALVLFLAAGCSASSQRAVKYVRDYARSTTAGGTSTPETVEVAGGTAAKAAPQQETLGLVRVRDGHVMGEIHWLAPDGRDLTIGALALGDGDVTDVAVDVSAEHARIWRDAQRGWLVEDLGSTNGTRLTDALSGEAHALEAGTPEPIRPGDELELGGNTTFVAIEGQP